MNRRDLLRIFSAGAVIAPVNGACDSVARIIEPPKVEPITTEIVPASVFQARPPLGEKVRITVDMVSEKEHLRFQAESFIVDCKWDMIDVTSPSARSGFTEYLPANKRAEYVIRGISTGRADFISLPIKRA